MYTHTHSHTHTHIYIYVRACVRAYVNELAQVWVCVFVCSSDDTAVAIYETIYIYIKPFMKNFFKTHNSEFEIWMLGFVNKANKTKNKNCQQTR